MTMTEKQEKYLRRLVEKGSIDTTLASAWDVTPQAATDRFVAAIESKSEASRIIDELLHFTPSEPDTSPRARRLVDSPDVDPPEGIHYLKDGDTITVYKVQRAVNGSGKLYAKRLHVDGPSPSWSYLGRGGAFRELSDATLLDLETAKQFGLLYGVCGICGRTLTDEVSIERGIGPVCFRKF